MLNLVFTTSFAVLLLGSVFRTPTADINVVCGNRTDTVEDCSGYVGCLQRVEDVANRSCVGVVMAVEGNSDMLAVVNQLAGMHSIPVVGLVTDSSAFVVDYARVNPRYVATNSLPQHAMRAVDVFLRSQDWCCCLLVIIQDVLYYDGFLDSIPKMYETDVYVISEKTDSTWNSTLSLLCEQPCRITLVHIVSSLSERFLGEAERQGLYSYDSVWIVASVQESKGFQRCPVGTVIIRPLKDKSSRMLRDLAGELAGMQNASQQDAFIADYRRRVENQEIDADGLNVVDQESHPLHVFSIDNGVVKMTSRKIVWPGETFSKPLTRASNLALLRVVTVPADPFMMVSPNPIIASDEDCIMPAGMQCLRIKSSDRNDVFRIEQQVKENRMDNHTLFDVFCCVGYVIDLLHQLSRDLQVYPLLYLVQDGKFGSVGNGTINGMVADVHDNIATLAVASLTVTKARETVINFTKPFLQINQAVLVSQRRVQPHFMAFLHPLDELLWFAAFGSCFFIALVSLSLEWFSPLGRCRDRQPPPLQPKHGTETAEKPTGRPTDMRDEWYFSLGSALYICFSLLWSRVSTERSPRSIAPRILLNCWTVFCIVFLSLYTANLAAHLASAQELITLAGVTDRKLLSLRVGAVRSSMTIDSFKNESVLQHRLEQFVQDNVTAGILQVKNNELDAFITDAPILVHAEINDPTCLLHVATRGQKAYSYGIGIAQNSAMEPVVSRLIADYDGKGFLESLQQRWFPGKQCYPPKNEAFEIGLEQFGGVFVTLTVAILFIIFLVLPLECLVHRFFPK